MAKARNIRIAAIGFGTLAIALGAGQVMKMQAGSARMAPSVAQTVVEDGDAPLELSSITHTSSLPTAPAATMAPVDLPAPRVQLAALDSAAPTVLPVEESAPGFACDYQMTATPAAAAMVALEITVPCMPNERFTLHHGGMMFTDATDAEGRRSLTVPALSATPLFIAAFANGEGAVASTEVTSFEYYDRVVVQWKGTRGLHLHALEYQAGYDSDGHVWAETPRDEAEAASGTGGFLVGLGAADMPEALLAEVYTFPSGLATRDGQVTLSVEAQVTPLNCGTDIEAQSIQIVAGQTPRVQDVVLAIPDCGATGDFLVLNNLLNDLKIAQN